MMTKFLPVALTAYHHLKTENNKTGKQAVIMNLSGGIVKYVKNLNYINNVFRKKYLLPKFNIKKIQLLKIDGKYLFAVYYDDFIYATYFASSLVLSIYVINKIKNIKPFCLPEKDFILKKGIVINTNKLLADALYEGYLCEFNFPDYSDLIITNTYDSIEIGDYRKMYG